MKGKRGLVMGVANNHSIAWGCAQALADQGAELAFTYQGENFERRVRPLAESVGSSFVMDADVTNGESLDAVFAALKDEWGSMDFLVHAIAYSNKDELTGRYADTSRANFLRTMEVSCYSFVDVARRGAELMPDGGGSTVSLTVAAPPGEVAPAPNDAIADAMVYEVRDRLLDELNALEWTRDGPRRRDPPPTFAG